MAKTVLGVDVGHDSLKLALCKGDRVKKAVTVPMPKNLVKEGRVVSTETMGELIKTTMREHGIRAGRAAYVLPNDVIYVRNCTMPKMTEEQLLYNIPYEFNDYITDELKNYVFDYAMLSSEAELKNDELTNMELMAVAVQSSVLDDTREILRKAGLKMVMAGPAVSAFVNIIRNHEKKTGEVDREYCMLDLGYNSIRMYMFKGQRHMVTRILEIGLSTLDQAIADAFNVDIHLAHTYLTTDYDGCQRRDFCMNSYNNIAVELMRALNFYRFSNGDSNLEDIWLCGGGAVIEPLRTAIKDTLDMNVHSAEELIDTTQVDDGYYYIQAAGITMQ
ncbi:MAG: pilus assembly protein PilM [Oscillospiraceae bacterium]|nr:pilus assembly protein PilM [Oscillospiraceae bacterium]